MGVEVNIRVDLPVELAEHVSHATGVDGDFDSIEAYVRNLIQRDMEHVGDDAIDAHREELQRAFAVPESDAVDFDRSAFYERMRQHHRL